MALTQLNAKLTTLRDTAEATLARHRSRMEQIRADRTLSPTGKAAELAKNYLTESAILKDLQRQETETLSTKRSELERKLFGQVSTDPSAIIAYRDAQDRVGRLAMNEQHKALEMLRTAALSGDKTLSAAVVGRALAVGWSKVMDQHTSQDPAVATELQDLADVIHFQENPDIQFTAYNSYHLSKPAEISRQADSALASIAEASKQQEDSGHIGHELLQRLASGLR